MGKKTNILIIFFLLCSITLIACGSEDNEVNSETTINKEEEASIESDEEPEVEEEEELTLPKESQQVSEFPWDDDIDFKKAQDEHDTHVLIAGFSTVSEDYTLEERDNIDLAASTINGTVINPGDVFSQNETAGPYTEEKGYKEGDGYVGGEIVKDFGGGVCNVATTLYNTSIASDLDIVERHNHSMPVPYVPYGQDAAVAYGYKDFKFKNDTEDPILIWTELVENVLYMGFYGKEAAPDIAWEHETLSETKTTTDYQINPDLPEGEENILIKGMDGKVVKSVLKIKNEDGEEEIKELGESAYNPMINLIERNE